MIIGLFNPLHLVHPSPIGLPPLLTAFFNLSKCMVIVHAVDLIMSMPHDLPISEIKAKFTLMSA